jgi:hypothetical protein
MEEAYRERSLRERVGMTVWATDPTMLVAVLAELEEAGKITLGTADRATVSRGLSMTWAFCHRGFSVISRDCPSRCWSCF